MKILDYYKKYLSEDVESVDSLYVSMNLTDDTSGIEFWDRVVYRNGVEEYYPSITEYDHNLVYPFDMPKEWLKVGELCFYDKDIPEELAEKLSKGRADTSENLFR